MKDELGEKRMKKSIVLRPKMYCYVTDGSCVDIKGTRTKEGVIKQEIKSEDYKNFLQNNNIM